MQARIGLLLVGILMAGTAAAAESMRCGSRLVTDGDPKAKVAALCGRPDYSEQRTIYRAGIPRTRLGDGRPGDTLTTTSDRELLIHNRSLVEVTVDVWVYNRGKRRLMREVVFEDNRVVELTTLGRGY